MKIPSNILKIINTLRECGYDAYLVGGCVRDSAMGNEPHDFDITTNALPEEIISCFDGNRIIETGLKHGTVTVVSEGENVEVTTYRIDGVYLDNRRPESVSFTSLIDEDLARRDFTVNAMAYNPYDGYVDIFGGMRDIDSKVIRCVGDADKRFSEDGLRILRAMRFASVLDFDIFTLTSESIHRNRALIKNISAERIYTELKKLICGVRASKVLEEYYDVMCAVFPMLECKKEMYMRNIQYLNELAPDYILRFSCILNGFEPDEVKSFMKLLKPDNDTLKNVIAVTGCSDLNLKADQVSVRYLMSSLSDDNIRRIAFLRKCFDRNFNCDEFFNAYTAEKMNNPCVSIKQLAVSGHDLMEAGISRGAEIGRYMSMILEAVIENKCENTKESIVSYLKIIRS